MYIYTDTHTPQTNTHTHTHTHVHAYIHAYILPRCYCAEAKRILILLYMCNQQSCYFCRSVSSYYYMCPHTTMYVSSYSYI